MRGTVPVLGQVGQDVAVKALPEIVTVVKEQAKRDAPKKRGLSSKKSHRLAHRRQGAKAGRRGRGVEQRAALAPD